MLCKITWAPCVNSVARNSFCYTGILYWHDPPLVSHRDYVGNKWFHFTWYPWIFYMFISINLSIHQSINQCFPQSCYSNLLIMIMMNNWTNIFPFPCKGNGGRLAQLQILDALYRSVATVQSTTFWVMSKAYQFLSSWYLNKFLLITHGDLGVGRFFFSGYHLQ